MTTTTTLADELRTAATTLRETAKEAAPGPWHLVRFHRRTAPNVLAGVEMHKPGRGPRNVGHQRPGEIADAEWSALVHPGLAEPLATLLDDIASEAERHEAHGMGNSQDEIITGPILDIIRVLSGGAA